MFFVKNEKKKRHPFIGMLVGAFATLGAVSLISAAKTSVKNGWCKMTGCIKNMCRREERE